MNFHCFQATSVACCLTCEIGGTRELIRRGDGISLNITIMSGLDRRRERMTRWNGGPHLQ